MAEVAQSVPAMVGVEQCAEGHLLQESAAEIRGRCEGCNRWVFGKEKVMSCACCSCYYCSVCSPQVLSGNDDHMWEDFLSTVGSALRDAERIKEQISSEMDFDLTRIRSAFNCQEPGNATLSAEQIFVEHAVDQVKSTLNCANPDISDLRSQEEVIERDPVEPAVLTVRQQESTNAGGQMWSSMREAPAEPPSEQPTVIADKPPVDLLDLSAQVQHVPAAQQQKPMEQAPVDLLDIPLDEDEQAPADLLDLPLQEETPPMNLVDMEAPIRSSLEESAIIANSSEKAPMDLLDLSVTPMYKATNEVAATDYQSLLQLSQSLAAPEANEPMANEPVVQAAVGTGPSKSVPEPVDLL